MAAELGHSAAQEAYCRGLLLVCKDHLIGEQRRVVNGHMNTVISDAARPPPLPVTGDAVIDLAKSGEHLEIDYESGLRDAPARTAGQEVCACDSATPPDQGG